MATYTKIKLSESLRGRGIRLSTGATVIHNSPSGTTSWDEIWLWVTNNDTSNADEVLTIQWGDSAVDKNKIEENITISTGLKLVISGLILQDSESVSGWGDNDSTALTIFGYVNRIT